MVNTGRLQDVPAVCRAPRIAIAENWFQLTVALLERWLT